MKKIYISLLTLVAGFSSHAQLTQANHAPVSGDTYDMYRCDSVNISPGSAGANAVWNFGSVTTYSNLVRSYTAQAVSNSTYAAASIAVASGLSDLEYLSASSSSLAYYGGNIGVGIVNGSVTYTSPAIYASYPMNLNTTASTAVSGTLYIPSLSASGTFTGTSSVTADGSGTINLPGSVTYSNVLRVVTSQTIYATTTLATATVTQVNYNYYASGVKAPVFSIGTATANISSFAGPSTTTQTFVARNKNATGASTVTTGVPSHAENLGVSAYPNPSTSFVNFSSENPNAKAIHVYDITGKLIEKQNFTDGKIKLNVSAYNKGVYLYTVMSADERNLKTGKIVVSED